MTGGPAAVLLADVLPVAALIGLGFALGRRRLVSDDEARALNRFALFVAAPPLVFGLLAGQSSGAFLPVLAGGYLAAELAAYGLVALMARRLAGRSRRESLLIGMSAAFANHVYFVLPVAQNVYGTAAATPILSVVTVDSVVILTGTVVLLDVFATGRASLASALRAVLRMPYVLAIFAGLGWSLAGWPVPEGLAAFTTFAGAAASPVALFAAGVVMARADVLRLDGLALGTVAAKLVLMPALAALAFAALGVAAVEKLPALLAAAGPAGSLAMALAIHYRVETATLGRILVLTTAGSVLTLSLLATPLP
ncbi:probable mdcF malonate transporter [Oceanicola granulosus HTCC2516]|uniref:Probable mdcF malonate transporter n=1 Tax=Oceanicola granulosus (strain ATCC BAA-861 / DSM 15982 / KCTC 12143 / HTCC2516) TaxID=314256 RepID=Q2CBM5_OCEGH|nr:AEC family transporter [Oceanicola granulosus]EAR50106.1 probable mdcF malonate transporter [Oceanicola granulosus HTCC2516]